MDIKFVGLWYATWTGLATWLATQYDTWLSKQDDENFTIPKSILVCFGVAGIEIMRVVRSIPLVLLICEPHGIPTSIVMLFVIEYVASFVTAYGPTGLVMVRGNLQREKRRAVNRRLEEADG